MYHQTDAGSAVCASLDGASMEAQVVQPVFAALHPAQLDTPEDCWSHIARSSLPHSRCF